MLHKVLALICIAGMITLLAAGCEPISRPAPTDMAVNPTVAITGVAQKVMAADQFIVLEAPSDGVNVLWFTDQSQIQGAAGEAIALQNIAGGAKLQATGWTQGSDIMIVESLTVLEDVSPAVQAPVGVTAWDQTITIMEPLEGASITDPVRVRGVVSVTPFENTLRGRVYNEQGEVVGEAPIAVAGTMGGLGTFDASLGFNVFTSGPGTVEIAEISARDGSIVVSAVVGVLLPMPEEIMISGGVAQVLTGAGLIHLTEINHGFSTVALAESAQVLSIDGVETSLTDIQPGMEIEARGQPGASGTLVARQVTIVDAYPQEIVLVTPKPGDTVADPIRLLGSVRLTPSEATLSARIVDPQGQILLETPFVVNGVTGGAGVFSTLITYEATYSGPATIEILEFSPQDGSVVAKSATDVLIVAEPVVTMVGRVANVDPDANTVSLTEAVSGVSLIATNAATRVLGADGTQITLLNLQPGMEIQVSGQTADGTWIAEEVRVISH